MMQGSPGVNQGSNCLEMTYGHQIRWEESLTKALCIAGVKGHVGVSWSQVGVNLLSNALWPPNSVARTSDQSIMHCWGQRSCRGQLGSTKGQLLRNDLWPPNLVGRIPTKRNALLGSKVMKGSVGVR